MQSSLANDIQLHLKGSRSADKLLASDSSSRLGTKVVIQASITGKGLWSLSSSYKHLLDLGVVFFFFWFHGEVGRGNVLNFEISIYEFLDAWRKTEKASKIFHICTSQPNESSALHSSPLSIWASFAPYWRKCFYESKQLWQVSQALLCHYGLSSLGKGLSTTLVSLDLWAHHGAGPRSCSLQRNVGWPLGPSGTRRHKAEIRVTGAVCPLAHLAAGVSRGPWRTCKTADLLQPMWC